MRPWNTTNLQKLSKTFDPHEQEHFCLHITWYNNLPSELYLKIESPSINRSRSYKQVEITMKMEIRLLEYLSFKDKYNVTLSFKTYGGVSDVSFCSKKGDFAICENV